MIQPNDVAEGTRISTNERQYVRPVYGEVDSSLVHPESSDAMRRTPGSGRSITEIGRAAQAPNKLVSH